MLARCGVQGLNYPPVLGSSSSTRRPSKGFLYHYFLSFPELKNIGYLIVDLVLSEEKHLFHEK